MTEQQRSVLLFNADFYGTLAAARCLGRLGIAVTIAESSVMDPARWSRYVHHRVRAPVVENTDGFLNWLVQFGEQNPGHILYPTSDDLAWIIAFHRERLSACYLLYSPPIDCIDAILNKRRLHSICQELHIAVPETYFPEDETALEELSHALPYPVLIKPETQVFFQTHVKGGLIQRREELFERYVTFTKRNTYADSFLLLNPEVQRPMIQRFYPEAANAIYGLSGFIDEPGELFVLRGSRKVLQRPRQIGIGLCFEEEDVHPQVRDAVITLCRKIGYYGVFEVEFIQTEQDGQYLLTDFNPRFYNQMAFDIARGMPLPEYMGYGACGNAEALRTAVEQGIASENIGDRVYCNKFFLLLMLSAQRMSGVLSATEAQYWKQWLRDHGTRTIDAAADPTDRYPLIADYWKTVTGFLKHPRSFVRSIVLNR